MSSKCRHICIFLCCDSTNIFTLHLFLNRYCFVRISKMDEHEKTSNSTLRKRKLSDILNKYKLENPFEEGTAEWNKKADENIQCLRKQIEELKAKRPRSVYNGPPIEVVVPGPMGKLFAEMSKDDKNSVITIQSGPLQGPPSEFDLECEKMLPLYFPNYNDRDVKNNNEVIEMEKKTGAESKPGPIQN
ncbi:uncharacterized protein LOC129572724 [Sitodiplosis mosellana]|uniref:uncharacterized protein LOC129572724 n=1 Tax=Sitodiplosis mosellana TaxID=263140 RepID=UPI0024447310|nr:uncharacterized protein LOC129572724 [Sitodiplosis mosellana]